MFSDMVAEIRESSSWRECELFGRRTHDEHDWLYKGEQVRCEGGPARPLVERIFSKFGWEDGHGTYPLWSRTHGENFGPPYDELAVLMTPTHWGLAIQYESDPTYRYQAPPNERSRSIAVQAGPFHLWLGRNW